MFNNPKQKAAVLFFAVICVIAFFERKPEHVEQSKVIATVPSSAIVEVKGLKNNDIGKKHINIRTDDLCNYFSEEITFPVGDNYLIDPPKGACLRGKNITRLIAGDSEITSASLNKEGDIFFYTIGKNNDGSDDLQYDVTNIMAVFFGVDGKPIVSPVLDSEKSGGDTPETSLSNMVVNTYNTNNSTLYFSTDAWAQSRAIHAIKFQNNNSLIKVSEKFITDGDFVIMDGDNLVVSKIAHDEQGAYFPSYLIAPSGKEICQLDTRQEMWSIVTPCLPKGEVLKQR